MLFWCCCPFLLFLCVLRACSGLYGLLCSSGTVCRWCFPVVRLPLVCHWSAVGACSGMVLLCQPRYHVHYVNHQTVWSESAQIFTGFSPPEPEIRKLKVRPKILSGFAPESALSDIAYMRAGKPKNFSGNDRLSDRCIRT